MRGSKQEWAPGRWRLRVYAGTDSLGRPVQRSRQFRGNAKAADAALRTFVDEVEQGKLAESDPTVADLLDRWHAHLAAIGKARPYTLAAYRYVIDAALKPALGRQKVARLTARHLDQQYHRWLEQGVSPSTVHKYHRVLSAALRQAVKWELVPRAVTALASPPSESDPNPRAMPVESIQQLIRAAEETDPVLAAAIALAAVTGCRRGELCGLRWSDYTDGTLTVARSVTVTGGGTVHLNATKTGKVRRLAVDPVCAGILDHRMAEQRWLAEEAGIEMAVDPWLLSRRADGGAPCLPDGITHAFGRLARRLGLPYHFHELRHWTATTALVGGGDVRTVAGRLGHSNPQLTLRQYAKFVRSADQLVAEELGRALGPVSGGDDDGS